MRPVSLIGLPASGKTTVGGILAHLLHMRFTDTDRLIEARSGTALSALLEQGQQAFRAAEEEAVLSLTPRAGVIATGGSVIYSEPAMRHLRQLGPVVYLRLGKREALRRLSKSADRPIVLPEGQDLPAMVTERMRAYPRWSNLTLDNTGTPAQAVIRIRDFLKQNQEGHDHGRTL